jgi:hypothetical protein
MGFVVDEVTLGQVFLRLLWFLLSSSFHQYFIIIFRSYTVGGIQGVSKILEQTSRVGSSNKNKEKLHINMYTEMNAL